MAQIFSQQILLLPFTGIRNYATPSNIGFGTYFFAGYGNIVRLDYKKNFCFSLIFQKTLCLNIS